MRILINHRNAPAHTRSLVRAAFKLHEADGPDVEVHIKRSAKPHDADGQPHFSGRAYIGVPRMARVAEGTDWLVTLRVCDPDADGFPFQWTYHAAKTAQATRIETWDEAVAYLAGHEARHVRQFQANLPRSEVDAEAAGLVALNHYRRNQRQASTG